MDVLKETNFGNLGQKKAGKVRDIYDQGDELILIATDRHSSFDRIIAHIPWKGFAECTGSLLLVMHTKTALRSRDRMKVEHLSGSQSQSDCCGYWASRPPWSPHHL